MHKGDIFRQYKNMSEADQRTFDRWLKANVVLSALMAAGLMAMAMASSNMLSPREAAAEAKSVKASERVKTAHELMTEMAPYRLPVEQVDEPF
jgi:hypothetical protein